MNFNLSPSGLYGAEMTAKQLKQHENAFLYFMRETRPYWKRINEMNIDHNLVFYFGVEPRFYTV